VAARRLSSTDAVIDIEYGQVYIYGRPIPVELFSPGMTIQQRQAEIDAAPEMRAMNQAYARGTFVGEADRCVDLLSPYQWHFDAAMTIEVWDGEPPAAEHESCDHVVDVDLEVIGGHLIFEAPTLEQHRAATPDGSYRARVAGQGYAASLEQLAGGPDSYRIALWPRIPSDRREPVLVKTWPGWVQRGGS
jgi:hypothetical protein